MLDERTHLVFVGKCPNLLVIIAFVSEENTSEGTTKECALCGVKTPKPIWVREHSCPSCGFETDRDANAAMNVLKRGFAELGLGWPEDTPVETVAATDADDFREVYASHVVETGSLAS